jgi:hypothetical protein
MLTNPASARGLAIFPLTILPLLALMPLLTGAPTMDPPAEPELCVIAPQTETDRSSRSVATVPLSQPTLFVREPLQRVRLLRGSTVVWERQAGLEGAIQGPIAWPLPPLRAGESLRLQLQPAGSGPSAFAEIGLRAADGATLRRSSALVTGLRADPAAWRRAVERAWTSGDARLAAALLFAFEGPSAPDLDALRLEAVQQSCLPGPAP